MIFQPALPIHGCSNNGWWDQMALVVGHDAIRRPFQLSRLSRPAVVITVDGMIQFGGCCDADDGHRRF